MQSRVISNFIIAYSLLYFTPTARESYYYIQSKSNKFILDSDTIYPNKISFISGKRKKEIEFSKGCYWIGKIDPEQKEIAENGININIDCAELFTVEINFNQLFKLNSIYKIEFYADVVGDHNGLNHLNFKKYYQVNSNQLLIPFFLLKNYLFKIHSILPMV